MKHFPDFEGFSSLAGDSDLVPVYRQLLSDTLTPVSAYGRLNLGDSSFLFESVVGGEQIGRYSFLGTDPFLQLEAYGQNVVVTDSNGQKRYQALDPLDELATMLEKYKAAHLPGLPRFCGGAVGYAGYDVVRYTENLPNAPTDDRQLPDLSFAFYNRMIIFDQINKTVLVVAHARTGEDDLEKEYELACSRVDELCRQLQQGTDDLQLNDISVSTEPCRHPSWTSEVASCVDNDAHGCRSTRRRG